MINKTIEITPLLDTKKPILCKMSDGLRKYLGLSKQLHSLEIACGMHTVLCPIVFINKEEDFSLALTKQTFDELHLPLKPYTLQGKLVNQKQLQLGPIIGLLADIKQTDSEVSLGSIEYFCEELATFCETKGIFFYIFSLSTYHNEQLKGFYFHQQEWHEAIVPYPNVVHNRIHSRKAEHSKKFLEVTSDFIKKKIPYFNDRFLNKWEVHQILSKSEHLMPYIPEAQLLESKSNLENMLKDKKDLFIKPINGSQGRRIFRVMEMNDQTYHLDFTTFSGDIKKDYDSYQQLFSVLYPRLKKEGFLLQETIKLKKYQNRTLDFRFLCHKKDGHTWKVTSAVARVSNANQFVANLARGGELYSLKTLLNELYSNKESRHLRKLLAELSLEIVNMICLRAGGEFGEFGIDLALDEDGHPWIIEVNTKPSKSNDSQKSKIRPSARAVINYCLFLSKFKE